VKARALSATLVSHPESTSKGTSSDRNEIVNGLGLVAFGRDLVSLDTMFFNLLGFSFKHFRGYINKAEEFGTYDRDAVKEAKMKVGDWLTL
jgi:uncharacterized protein (DUF362 family)